MNDKLNSNLINFLVFFSGLITCLSFSPFHISIIALLSIGWLFYTTIYCSPKKAAWRGYLFGLGYFGSGISWVFISINTFGFQTSSAILNLLLSGLLTTIFICFLSLYIGFSLYISTKFSFNKSILKKAIIFSVIWILVEILRGWMLTGFPWLYIGYSQTNTFISSLAPLGGIYLVSLSVVIVATFSVLLLVSKNLRLKVKIVIYILIILSTSLFLKHKSWTTPSNPNNVSVSLVQANISQNSKWNPDELNNILKIYDTLTKQNIEPLIFWSENSIPIFPEDIRSYLRYINDLGIKNNAAILVGLPYMDKKTGNYYNAAQVLGYGHGLYLKHQLVPFGEYFPLNKLLGPTLRFMNIPASNFSAGPKKQPYILMNKVPVSIFICYEIAFPEQVKNQSKSSSVIAVISDDAWFGNSLGPWQHLQLAQMRAIENGRYVIQSTNDGITAIINQYGQVTKQLPQFKRAVLTGKVMLFEGQTPWQRYGIIPILMLLILLLIISVQPFTKQQN